MSVPGETGIGDDGSGVATPEALLRHIADQARSELRLPDIDGLRCVHSLVEQASCRACVDACPRQAWLLDDDGLNLDTRACDGCGLCVPACPQGALQQPREVLHGRWRGHHVAAIACERAGVSTTTGMLPCVHSLGERELLRLHRDGVTHLVSCRGDCDTCPRHTGRSLEHHLRRINRVLAPRKVGRLSHTATDARHWRQLAKQLAKQPDRHRAGQRRDGPTLSRRAFFRTGIECGTQLFTLHSEEQQHFLAPGELLDEHAATLPLPYVPSIDPDHCNACHACARLCPQGAIELLKDDSGSAYRLNPTLCSGCNICRDSCDQDAVHIATAAVPSTTLIPLLRHHCPACGAPFLRTTEQPEQQPLCPICTQTNHQRLLFQVYQ